jgi:hypothetical protein
MKSEEFFLVIHGFCFFVGFLYDWQNKIGSFYAIWINSIYEFWHLKSMEMEIKSHGKKERKGKLNWARGLGGGFLYLSSLWCNFFLPRILPFIYIASFQKIIKNVMHTLVNILFFKT